MIQACCLLKSSYFLAYLMMKLDQKLWYISLQNLRIVLETIFFYGWVEVLNVKHNEFAKLFLIYTLIPVDDVFCTVHWFTFNLCLTSLLIASVINIINLLNLWSSLLAGFIGHTNGLSWKFPLWSFKVMKQLLSPLMSYAL